MIINMQPNLHNRANVHKQLLVLCTQTTSEVALMASQSVMELVIAVS